MAETVRDHLIAGEQRGERYRLTPPRRAPLGTVGSQLARTAGESMEFMEHRDYHPGDDLRRMNWSAYARTDKLVVKVFRQEVCPHFDLVLDSSASMSLAGTQKLKAATELAATLACAAGNSGYSRKVYQTREGCQPLLNGGERPQLWEGLQFDCLQSPAEAFRLRPAAFRPHGVRIFISDLLWLGDPYDILNCMADRAASVVVIQLLAAEDADPGQLGNQRLIDSETGESQEVFVDAGGLEVYRRNLARHQQEWRMAANKVGATMITLIAEDLCRDWDLSPLIQAEVLSIS